MILSQGLFKFEVEKCERCHEHIFYPNFFKIKLLYVCHETLCYLIDSLNLYKENARKMYVEWANSHFDFEKETEEES